VFAQNLSKVVATDKYFHTIDTGGTAPVRKQPYRTNPQMQVEINKQVQALLDADIIEEAMTPWQEPVVMVKKPHVAPEKRKWRMVIDYRGLNKVTTSVSFKSR
jgi:hypothetical protein